MRKRVLFVLALVCVGLSPFASALPDGLATVLEGEHLANLIHELTWPIFADYQVGFVSHPYVTSWLAGGVGIVIVVLSAMALLKTNRKKFKSLQ